MALLRRPSDFFGILAAFAKGRRAVAEHLTRLGYVDAESLPLRRDFLDYLERERASGRELHLAASAMQPVADAVAARLGIFGSARGSENGVELRGDAKLHHLQQRFPDGFSYAGGGGDDIPVWRGASSIVIVGASPATQRTAERLGPPIEREFPAAKALLAGLDPGASPAPVVEEPAAVRAAAACPQVWRPGRLRCRSRPASSPLAASLRAPT